MKNIIVLNASQNTDGNSIRLAKEFLAEKNYHQVNLVDYHIEQIGQVSINDQLDKLIDTLRTADKLIITSPVYWSDMPGYLKTFIDRSGNPMSNRFKGIDCFLLIQGMEPSDAIGSITHVINHWATRDGMNFKGEATYNNEIKTLRKEL